jgi:CAAX protease family protein
MNVFAAPGQHARPTPVWAAFFLLWAFWLIANLATVPFLFFIMAPALLAGDTLGGQGMGLVILVTLYVMFSVFAACALIWLKVYERRHLASAGIIWRGALGRYGRGLFWGGMFALVLVLTEAFTLGLVPEEAATNGPFSWEILMRPDTMAVFAVLSFGLLLQSAAEEVICRGWVLSSVSLRHGRMAGLVASALFFGSLHVHFLFADNVLAGLVAIIAVTLMGAMLGLYALGERSIIGPAGMHGAFNAIVFGVTLAVILGTGEASDPLAGLNTAYELSTQPKQLGAESFVQGGLALAVSLYLWWRLRQKFSSDDKQ